MTCRATTTTPQSARLRARSEKQVEQGDDVSEESEESEIEEELGFFSLIDAINPYTTFKHALMSRSPSSSVHPLILTRAE